MNCAGAMKESAKKLGFYPLMNKKLEVISCFLQGNDTIGSLPTDYGKSAIYTILPIMFERIKSK